MKEEDKTKEQLIDELKTLRTRLTELEASETYWRGVQKLERPYSRRLRALPKIVHTLAQPMVFQKKVFHVVQQLVYALGADAAAIRMADQERKELPLLVTAETAPSPSYYTPVLRFGEGITGQAVMQKHPVVVNNLAKFPCAVPAEVGIGVQSMASVAITAGEQVLGVLSAGSNKPNHFTPKSIELLASAADGISLALESARMEEELRIIRHWFKSYRSRFQRLVEHGWGAIFLHDIKGRFIGASRRACDILGYTREELLTLSVSDVELNLTEEQIEKQWIGTVPGVPITVEAVLQRKDGTTFPTESCLSMFNSHRGPLYLRLVRDVTEQKRGEEALRQSQRLEVVGQLAAAVAHEVNNSLAIILGFSQLLLARETEESAKKDLQTIFEETQRAKKVVHNLLSFAGQQKSEKIDIDVRMALNRALALKAYDFQVTQIEVETYFDPDVLWVKADEQQLQQVLLNILTNAEHAMMEAHGKGRLSVITKPVGNNVRLSITDDGLGISKDNLSKIFNPFFTTKETDRGTGLGLSVSYGIIVEHGGHLWAESEPGNGATFHIELPVSTTPETQQDHTWERPDQDPSLK